MAQRLCSDGKSRRIVLADAGMGLAGLALGTLLPQKSGIGQRHG